MCWSLPLILAAATVLCTAPAYGQPGPSDHSPEVERCVVRKEPSGLIRGDRIPSGCLLRSESSRPAGETEEGPLLVCEETFFYTPNPKRSVLANCVNLSGGRLVIPRVGPSAGKFGPLDRPFGPIARPFGPLVRPFGPVERPFGPLERNFGVR